MCNTKKKEKEDDCASINLENGEEPLEPPSPSSSESYSSSYYSHHSIRQHKNASKKFIFKLYVKFDFPMFNKESNAKKLNNWIRQIEVYCCIQQIK